MRLPRNGDMATDELALAGKESTVLDLSSRSLTAVPPGLHSLSTLVELNISRNALEHLCDTIGQLSLLTDLDISHNHLQTLPHSICGLAKLRYFNAMANKLTQLPDDFGRLSALIRIGLKDNQLASLPPSFGKLTCLRELFMTNNHLKELPATMQHCVALVKFQASFNQLRTLPPELKALQKLELFRVAVNDIQEVPREYKEMNSLAWFSLGGNPACGPALPPRPGIAELALEDLHGGLAEKLGDDLDLCGAEVAGASGDVFCAQLVRHSAQQLAPLSCAPAQAGIAVAVKVFKGEVSPDGRASDEIAVSCALDHPNLIKVVGMLEAPHALVLGRVFGRAMAAKPNLESLLRCRWAPATVFAGAFIASVAGSVAAALEYLHARRICHGDVYAHNVLVDEAGAAVLCDYGASFFYYAGTLPYEAQEVRAFGLFLRDMVSRLHMSDSALGATLGSIVQHCLANPPSARPSFKAICSTLEGVAVQLEVRA